MQVASSCVDTRESTTETTKVQESKTPPTDGFPDVLGLTDGRRETDRFGRLAARGHLRRAVVRAGLCALLAAASCLLPSYTRVESTASDEGSAGAAGGGAGAGGSGLVCNEHAKPPARPALDPGGTQAALVFAWRGIWFHRAADGGPLGLDLDGFCTCSGGAGQECKPVATICDDESGRDNAAEKLLYALDLVNGTPIEDELGAGLAKGLWTVLIRIDDYNGSANDAKVRLRWYVSRGFSAPSRSIPAWDGTDAWTIDERSIVGGVKGNVDAASFDDPSAYVANGVLVGALPLARLDAHGEASALGLRLTSVALVAKVAKAGAGFRLENGVIGARLGEADAFALLASYRSDEGEALCRDNDDYAGLALIACHQRDVSIKVGGPTTPCGAISLALAFEAEPATLGDIVAAPTPQAACMPGKDPATGSCAKP